jgi:uncharacterized NAD(P)/FAD-binding protein YdhS
VTAPDPKRPTELAIIGLGSWGLCVLERTVQRARTTRSDVVIHVVEPGDPGGGVYNLRQPDYLVLNNPCGQLSLHASPESGDPPPYAVGLFEWVEQQGYRWVGYECRPDPDGEPIKPTDYLPRRVMGEYLGWFYETLVGDAPPNVTVVRHNQPAVDVVSEAGHREKVVLEDGSEVVVDHVVLTSGHTYNSEVDAGGADVRQLRPYPIDFFALAPEPGDAVAIGGMGLVAVDLMTALTVGRGGSFAREGDRLRYEASGREPTIYLFSRSGLPFCAKSATGIDPTGAYEPIVCPPGALSSIRRCRPAGRQVNFRDDVLPLILAEMSARYYTHSSFLRGGAVAERKVRDMLQGAWRKGKFEQSISALAGCYGAFDPEPYLLPREESFSSGEEYERHVYRLVDEDLDAALSPGGSPVKAALEVTRILRDELRSVLEFGGLSLHSFLDFQSNIRGNINRIDAGPPADRSAQLLALMDAGIVRIPFGPSPELAYADPSAVTVTSTRLLHPERATVQAVVRGHLDLPSLSRSASVLLANLYTRGRLTQLSYGDVPVGSVAISEEFHPFDIEGRLQENLSVLGVLTEGVRYFTHYLPSPQSRLRAVLDAQACVEAVIR